MSKLRYFCRKHLKGVTKGYQYLRSLYRNMWYVRYMKWGGVKCANTLFFVIEPRRQHPGLADRIKAIIACYNQAKKNGMNFRIVFKEPFNLDDFLVPADKNHSWNADFSDLEYSFFRTRFVSEHRGWNFKANPKCQYHCYNYTGDIIPEVFEDTGYKWVELYNELFTPSPEIQQAIQNIGIPPKSYIAVHLRFVNALECFEGGYYNGLKTESEKEALIQRCRNGISKIMAEHIDQKIMVFSDSKRFINECADLGVITLPSDNIGHVCFDNNHSQVVKTFLDQYMISRASKVYMIVSDGMYSSSCFALCGARMGGVPFEVLKV